MRAHQDRVVSDIKALAYLFKQLDPDGVEIANTSSPQKIKKFKKSDDVATFINQTYKDGWDAPCNMEKALEIILGTVREKFSKRTSRLQRPFPRQRTVRPVSVYIVTDGRWDDSTQGLCGADKPVETLIKAMKVNGIGRTQISLQFIRYGNEDRGRRRLEILDNELAKRSQNEG
jgi:hypothetical protein